MGLSYISLICNCHICSANHSYCTWILWCLTDPSISGLFLYLITMSSYGAYPLIGQVLCSQWTEWSLFFQKASRGWCEKMVDLAEDSSWVLPICICVLNLKEMCNTYFAAGFALFCLPILQPLYFTSPSVVDGLALRNLRRLSRLKSAPRQWSLPNKSQIELVRMVEVLLLLTMAKTE